MINLEKKYTRYTVEWLCVSHNAEQVMRDNKHDKRFTR